MSDFDLHQQNDMRVILALLDKDRRMREAAAAAIQELHAYHLMQCLRLHEMHHGPIREHTIRISRHGPFNRGR